VPTFPTCLRRGATAVVLLAAAGSIATGPAMAQSRGTQRAVPTDPPTSPAEAGRFLTRATYGVQGDDVDLLTKFGYSAWLARQWAMPSSSHRAHWEAADARIKALDPNASAGQEHVLEAFWRYAINGPDQLKLRTTFALSQIFVISGIDGNVGNQPRGMAAWYDLLESKSTGTYRELLESVALSPMMGLYLSHLRNQKADPVTGRVPDQNFAREILQLMSIGIVKLNPDGTTFLQNNQPVETYTPDDIAGLAKVFTGFSWACPLVNNGCFQNGSSGGQSDPDRAIKPMQAYPAFHSTEVKTFLGLTIPAQATANPMASLTAALDHIAAHPNVAPFISRQLIQRFTGSNPSPAYVLAVANVFNNNGSGVRGDLKAVVNAILRHPEALASTNSSGKLKEPVLKLAAYLRAFPHTSDTGSWRVGFTESNSTSLGQGPLRPPSVFNFYRPGYVAPNSVSAAAGLGSPELQLVNETSVAGWVNFMRDNLSNGVGVFNNTVGTTVFNRRDLQRDWSNDRILAESPEALAKSIVGRLMPGVSAIPLQDEIASTVVRIAIPAPTGSNQAAIDTARRNRLYSALLLTLASPEFQLQN
jgi:uncharacterized protein (DUF1800 family)